MIIWLSLLLAGLLPGGHSHNDYLQPEPFGKAARSGMCSLEADVFPVHGRLLVAHTPLELNPARDLATLYLRPAERWPGDPIELLVDIKADPEKALELLESELRAHPQARFSAVVLTGARPARTPQLGFITVEGTVSELRAGSLPAGCRYVSGPWRSFFQWQGLGAPPAAEQAALDQLVRDAHQKNCRLRLWGAPDTPAAWAELFRAGVDRINTDHPQELGEWLRGQSR